MKEQIQGYETVDKWLGRLAASTGKTSMVFVRKFMRWLKENGGEFAEYTPDELVAYQKNADNGQQYDVLDLIQRYVGQLDLRAGSKQRGYAALRSLFAHNRAELPKDPTFRIRSQHTPVQGILTVNEIRDMVLSCNKVYQAIFLTIFQGGMGLDEFNHWNLNGWDKLRQDLRGDPDIIKIDFPGRSKLRVMRPFYTLVGSDAIKALKEWVDVRPPDAEAIFTNQYGAPFSIRSIQLYWIRHLEKLGFIKREKNGKSSNRYGKNPHEMRDVFRSQWEKSPAKGSVAEFMMGHVVDPLFYNKACRDDEWVREEYLQALPMLEIMSSDTPFGKFDGKTVSNLKGRISELEAIIEEMTPAFRFAQTLLAEKRERDGSREASKEPEDAGAKEAEG